LIASALAAVFATGFTGSVILGEVVIIANPAPDELGAQAAKKLFLSKTRSLSSMSSVTLVSQTDASWTSFTAR